MRSQLGAVAHPGKLVKPVKPEKGDGCEREACEVLGQAARSWPMERVQRVEWSVAHIHYPGKSVKLVKNVRLR